MVVVFRFILGIRDIIRPDTTIHASAITDTAIHRAAITVVVADIPMFVGAGTAIGRTILGPTNFSGMMAITIIATALTDKPKSIISVC